MSAHFSCFSQDKTMNENTLNLVLKCFSWLFYFFFFTNFVFFVVVVTKKILRLNAKCLMSFWIRLTSLIISKWQQPVDGNKIEPSQLRKCGWYLRLTITTFYLFDWSYVNDGWTEVEGKICYFELKHRIKTKNNNGEIKLETH